ncbi:MAG: polyphosphate kinase 2 [Lentisphaeraceae bacterium]|nr:polyphosphate kinase 2 [Lentisphaeraceae bacterium]
MAKYKKENYEKELLKLQLELVKLQAWIKEKGLKVVVLFEGRDAAGKGGAIKRIREKLSPRLCKVVALSKPTDAERGQWYFQRYIQHLPTEGQMVLFDRSWYNRAGVEKVMGFCSEEEHAEFLNSCPEFERMLVRSGIILIKYWFSVPQDKQEERFLERLNDPMKRWKFSGMDIQARLHWADYSNARNEMFKHTNIPEAPWHVVPSKSQKKARLNCISHLLSVIKYKELSVQEKIELPDFQDDSDCKPIPKKLIVPQVFE